MRKAIITGGAFYYQNLFKVCNGKFGEIFKDRIYLLDLENTDLSSYDYLIIASRLNGAIMQKNAKKLQEYLENGGNIISFGGIPKEYLPNVKFEEGEVNFWWWINEGADLPMYAYNPSHKFWDFLELKECKWHYHGYYDMPQGCEKIIVDEIGRVIFYKDSKHFKGTLYVTSLDPDFHIGQGFMPATIPFLEKFITYVESDIKMAK